MSAPPHVPRFGNYIDGATAPPAAGTYLETENPYTGAT